MTSLPDLVPFEWPRDRLAEALGALAQAAGWRAAPHTIATAESDGSDASATNHPPSVGFADLARAARLDAEVFDVPARQPLATLRRMSPLVLDLPRRTGALIVLRCGRGSVTLVGPRGATRVPLGVLEDLLWADVDRQVDVAGTSIQGALDRVFSSRLDGQSRGQSIAVGRVLAAPSLAGRPLAEAWKVRPISGGLVEDLRHARVFPRFAGVIAAFVAQFALFIAIWRQVGARVLTDAHASTEGTQSWGAFVALLGCWVVAQLVASRAISRLALDVGAVVRVWLLRGALRVDGERIRSAGVGQLLGRALDAETLDVLALGGGVQAVAGIFELTFGVAVLGFGAAAWAFAALTLTLCALGVGVRIHARRLTSWCHIRRELTHDLVERMVGHRTALIQDRPPRRQAADEAALTVYDRETRGLDRAAVWVGVGLPRGWLCLGLLALAPLVLSPLARGASGSAIAMSVGGVWLVYSAMRRLGIALPMLSSAREAWGRIAPMVGAPHGDTLEPSKAAHGAKLDGPEVPAPLVSAEALAYRYPGRPTPVLEGASLEIAAGDRILIEGASGGGKSTLAALLTGLKVPDRGRLRLRGVDQQSLGLARWRRAVGAAPQFHDNHVMGADLLFNLLMGRRWPPRVDDVVAAERVCRELGLGPLLERMPAGLQQQVGETGWQLSHGERSRLFVARSLLQVLDARVLDESFAALDPETLDQVMEAVLRHPEALVVIAHP